MAYDKVSREYLRNQVLTASPVKVLVMLYDGNCGFCKRSMAGFLAFDGLSQIEAKDFHKTRSKLVTREQADKALYTLTADGQAYPGFDAYRHVVARVPGLWLFGPLFHIPWLSRAVGQPVYAWVASNRKRLSQLA